MQKEIKTKCPKCGEKSMEILCRGKNQRLWACKSSQCSKGSLQMALFFQMGNNVPVCFELKPGQMHAIEECQAKENDTDIAEVST